MCLPWVLPDGVEHYATQSSIDLSFNPLPPGTLLVGISLNIRDDDEMVDGH
jgi:hypothetical protein